MKLRIALWWKVLICYIVLPLSGSPASQGGDVIYTKNITTNLVVEAVLERQPPRGVSQRNLSSKERQMLELAERQGTLARPESFDVYRLFLFKTGEGRKDPVWSRSVDVFDLGPHFPPAISLLDATLLNSNLFLCYKYYTRLLVETVEVAPSPRTNAPGSEAAAVLYQDTTASGWSAISASFRMTNDSAMALEVTFPYERKGRWLRSPAGAWIEQPIQSEMRPGVFVSRISGIDVQIVEVRRDTNATPSATLRLNVDPSTCVVTANNTQPTTTNGMHRVFKCPIRAENNYSIHVEAVKSAP